MMMIHVVIICAHCVMTHFLEQLVHWSIESDTAAPIIKPCTAHTVVLNI